MVFSEINGLLTFAERVYQFFKRRRAPKTVSVATRFLSLFESHGVHRNQIPRFFGRELTLQDVSDESTLLQKLSEPTLAEACQMFGVKREWLDGVEEDPYVSHDFYKSPEEFERFVSELKEKNPEGEFGGYLVVPKTPTDSAESILILEESVGSVGEKPVYRYHVCSGWVFEYWKSRAYLTACVAIAWKRDIYVKGHYADARGLMALNERKTLLPALLEKYVPPYPSWYAEDMALRPEQFLLGIDPEIQKFGITSALNLWLSLDKGGWMDAGMGMNVRPLFEAELEKYSGAVRN